MQLSVKYETVLNMTTAKALGLDVPTSILLSADELIGIPQRKKTGSPTSARTGLPPWGPHVRFRRVQTLVREGSPLVKLRNSA